MLRKLGSLRDNTFTTKLHDLIVPDARGDEQIPFVFIIMDHFPMDLRFFLDNAHLKEQHATTIVFNLLRVVEYSTRQGSCIAISSLPTS